MRYCVLIVTAVMVAGVVMVAVKCARDRALASQTLGK